MNTVQVRKMQDKKILNSLKRYKKSMGEDLTSFAQNLDVTRQRVRVVARENGIVLPFGDDVYLRYERAIRENSEEHERLLERSRNLDLTEIGLAPKRKKPSKTKKKDEVRNTKAEVVSITSKKRDKTTDSKTETSKDKPKGKGSTPFKPKEEQFLLKNADRPWTHLSDELGVSYYRVRRFLTSKGLKPAGRHRKVDKPKKVSSK